MSGYEKTIKNLTGGRNNKMNTVEMRSRGLSFGSFLALIFITLKLTNVITWSWWWVLSPFWIPFALVLGIPTVIIGLTFITLFVYSLIEALLRK
jgi:hypothetical protein